jgi:hypothetical protein
MRCADRRKRPLRSQQGALAMLDHASDRPIAASIRMEIVMFDQNSTPC